MEKVRLKDGVRGVQKSGTGKGEEGGKMTIS